MTPEDRLRQALDDLAPRPPADDEAYAGVRRSIGRRHRRQVAGRLAAAVAVVGLGAGAAILATGGRGGPSVQTPATQPPATTEPGPTTTTTTPEGTRVHLGKVSFVPPPGWVALGMPEATTDESVRGLCVAPVGDPGPSYEGCSGVMIFSGDPLPGYKGDAYEQDGPWQFAHATGPIPCPFDDPPGSTIEPGPAGRQPINSGGRAVGDHTAAYDRWFARCGDDGATFTPEAWLLPQSKILIVDVFGHDETQQLLDSFEFDSP
jgi:hypothetical protein